ncbi:hypothetical protein BDN72DRAFT_842476 [Pluteus cervinus]|uniref:Uncharacterized protein n=1 Tax=Pluteus cervinus TaxID=181527 RepID=A0ACD3ASK0_9AGAR|nr:hypothetical protein BDN72DRAFT_842476 [Pluteus cervinus]
MPATVIHAAIFTAGALIGGSLAAIATRRNLPRQPAERAVIEIDTYTGRTQLSESQASFAASSILKYGNPGPICDLLRRQAFVVGYDRRLRHPSWTAEHLTAARLSKSPDNPPVTGDRSKSTFGEDEELPSRFRATLKDYFRSGYDRGHMVPAADAKTSQTAMDETFLLSNIAPQVGVGFNRHYWAYLEDWCRKLTNNFTDVYVFTVPLYLPKLDPDGKWRVTYEVIGSPPNVSVPTHFAKVVLASKPSSSSSSSVPELSTGAFVVPNAAIPEDAPLESFIVPVEAVERAAGLTLFSESVKSNSVHICKRTQCRVTVRRFDEAQRRLKGKV